MKPPRLTTAEVDWPAALSGLDEPTPRLAAAGGLVQAERPREPNAMPVPLARINAAMESRAPGVAQSPVPVLLPFDVEALLRDEATAAASGGDARYLSGFQPTPFFYAGPSGYDAVYSLRTAEVPEFSDVKFSDPIEILISGSSLLYDLDDPTPATGTSVPSLEAEYPGIRRLLHEHHLRYTFVRFGVPYAVSTPCFNAGVSRYRMPTCRAADRVLVHFLRALRLAGGTPAAMHVAKPSAIERPVPVSAVFRYHPAGRLLPATGFRGRDGNTDSTVYSRIRFPLAQAPAFINSQMFQSRNRPLPGQDGSPNYSYPWRDNFCERRGFPVGQCPAGHGHQGQDIRTQPCPGGAPHCASNRTLVAVRDGVILRRPKQEAVYLFVNTAHEHIRFRYLHMVPRKMDEDNLLSGRRVREGEPIAAMGNFHRREGGTSYHLHFHVQVPTRDGWVFVNPYMTLVAAYERLIGERGEPVPEPAAVASSETPGVGTVGTSTPVMEPEKQRARPGKRVSKKSKHARNARHAKRKKARLSRR